MTQLSQSEERRLHREWWKEAVVYQIYPRSFNDSDGDGVGDIPGIIERVDYLDDLGVDTVWLCPVYDSPNADNGYDIRDYRAIMDEFGEMSDWERLRDELHDRDMRIIMDLVVNHTASEHEWFQHSRRNDPEYADYYHWVEGEPDEPPNNWESLFGGSAWSYDDRREAWYLHVFDENQPDLNWRSPAVREDVRSIVTWWLDKGIDGFRMDAVSHLSKAEGYPDGDPENSPVGAEHYTLGPDLENYLEELGKAIPEEAVTAAEMGGTSAREARKYIECGDCLDMVFHFDHMEVGGDSDWTADDWGEWDLPEFKRLLTRNQREVARSAWEALFLGNHDNPRLVSRFGDEQFRRISAKLVATFLLTMRGTPFLYQGQELGMTNAEFDSLAEVDDVMTVGIVEELLATGEIDSFDEVRAAVNYRSRDHARTPMQWTGADGAGFTDGDPWLALNDNYADINVEAALADRDSVWHYYRRLIDLRNRDLTLIYGDYDLHCLDDEQIYAYTRTLGDEHRLVVLNWSSDPATFDHHEIEASPVQILIGNYDDTPTAPNGAEFRPYEAAVYSY